MSARQQGFGIPSAGEQIFASMLGKLAVTCNRAPCHKGPAPGIWQAAEHTLKFYNIFTKLFKETS